MRKTLKVMLLLLCMGATTMGIVSCETKAQKEAKIKAEAEKIVAEKEAEQERKRNEDPYLVKGWNFILNRLKSPSTASLVGYVSPKEEANREMAKTLDIDGLEIAAFSVDAQNSFGAMLRSEYFVFYRNGTPKVIMEKEDLVQAMYSYGGLKHALNLMGYFN